MDQKHSRRLEQKAVIRDKRMKALDRYLADIEENMRATRWRGFRRSTISEEEIQKRLDKHRREFLRNDSKSYRYKCRCEWCIGNKTFSTIKEKNRMNYEHIEAFDLISADEDAII